MNDRSITSARMRIAMDKAGFNQTQLARAIGVTQGAISQILNDTTAKSKHLPDIAEALGVSFTWLSGKDVEHLLPAPIPEDRPRVQIAEIDLRFGMGGGTFLDSPVDVVHRDFDPGWLQMITSSSPEMLFVARGMGDSMMPTLLDDDLLVVDRGQTKIAQQDRIWALTYGDLGMVKRVRRKPDGTYLLLSDNPAISAIEATYDEFRVVGRVAFIGRKA